MDDEPLLTCPRCGNEGHFHHADVEQRSNGLAMLLIGGLWAYWLSRPSDNMYICDRCHYVFEPDPRINKWVALSIVIFCGVALLSLLIFWLAAH